MILVSVAMACACRPITAAAQTALVANGLVESTSGGFKFSDGSIQATVPVPAPVADTGQTTCYDEAGMVHDCDGTGEDGELQAGLAWPTPRFTDNRDGTIRDNLTRLIWLKLANCFGARTWTEALSDANGLMSGQCELGDGSVAGDWRLPNVKELLSLVDYGESDPPLHPDHPFTLGSYYTWSHWSSTTRDGEHPELAWMVRLLWHDGGTSAGQKWWPRYLWPVRDGP
jgi:hypothetical protein